MQEKPKKKLPGVARDNTRVDTSKYVSPEDQLAGERKYASGLMGGPLARDEDGVPFDARDRDGNPVAMEYMWNGTRRVSKAREGLAAAKSRIKNRDEWIKKMFGS